MVAGRGFDLYMGSDTCDYRRWCRRLKSLHSDQKYCRVYTIDSRRVSGDFDCGLDRRLAL